MAFIVLRDSTGFVQMIWEKDESDQNVVMNDLTLESVISIRGKVREVFINYFFSFKMLYNSTFNKYLKHLM